MIRSIFALRYRKPAYLSLCIALAFSAPAMANDNGNTNAATTTNASANNTSANAAPSTVDPQSTADNTKSLEGVKVTATNAAVVAAAPSQGSLIAIQPQSVIGSQYLHENIPVTGDYTDAMALSPSVYTVAPNGAGLMEASVASIRGFQDGQYNVTFDGIPWGDSNDFTHHSTSYYTNADTSSVTVDRGPGTASTLGNATFGGTVTVDSIVPKSTFSISPFVSYGSWDTVAEGASINTGVFDASGGTAVINVQNSTSDGYLSYAGQRRQNIFAKVVQPIGENTTLTFAGMYNKINQYVPLGETRAQIQEYGPNYGLNNDPNSQAYYRYNLDQINTYFGYVGLHSEFDGWTIDNKAYTLAYNHFGYNGEDPNGETPNGTYYSPDDVPGQRMRNWNRSWGDIFRIGKEVGPGEFRTGFWYDDQDNLRWQYEIDDSRNLLPNGPTLLSATDRYMTDVLKTFQPFAEYQWNITDTAWLVGGFKYADFQRNIDAPVNQKTETSLTYEKDWNKLLPSLALHWEFSSNWTAYAQWAKGFLAPNLNTFYTVDPSASSNLKPEQTTNLQAGTTWTSDKLTLSADVYHINFTNEIQSRNVGGVTEFFNEGGAQYKGIELEGTYLLGGGLSVYANGSLNRAIDDATNTWIPDAPHKTAALGLIYHEGPMYASLIDKFVGHTFGDTDGAQPIGGYAITNFAASYQFQNVTSMLKNIKVGVQINNIFDNKNIFYLAGYTAADSTPLYFTIPARSYQVTLSADF